MSKSCLAAVVALFLYAASPATIAFADPATAPAAHDASYWKALEDRLGNEDPKIRAAAQKELGLATLDERPKLLELRDACTDDEVKARLQARLNELEEQVAIDPPPISLELKDASLSEVTHALHAATGVSMTSWPPDNDYRHATFTLSAQKEPFWQLFTELSAQHALIVQRNDRFQIMQQEPGMLHGVKATGGGCFFAGTITRSKNSNLQAAPGSEIGEEQMNMSYTLAVDPRIKVLRYSAPILTEVTDDAGIDLLGTVAPETSANNMTENQQNESLFPGNTQLVIPANIGKTIATLKGHGRMLVQVSEERLDIPDPQAKLNQPLTIAGHTVTIAQFQPKDQIIEFSLTSDTGRRIRGREASIIRVQFLDKSDQTLWDSRLYGGSGGSIGTGGSKPPFKIRFSVANKTKEVPIEFEAHNIPLP